MDRFDSFGFVNFLDSLIETTDGVATMRLIHFMVNVKSHRLHGKSPTKYNKYIFIVKYDGFR